MAEKDPLPIDMASTTVADWPPIGLPQIANHEADREGPFNRKRPLWHESGGGDAAHKVRKAFISLLPL
jgi:hypothetical protein